ncbi:MAG TPA: response regulator transcription factor [Deinococcales bacterium]|nr:response regulator transcription factor [Deinococcales bacterium]
MRLLVVEDDAGIRQPLAGSLREAGYATDEAADLKSATGLADTYPYDALIVDVRLPEGPDAGFDFVQRLRTLGVRSPVLFLTARDSLEDRVRGLDTGGDDYLVKPFQIAEVQAHLRALLRRARPIPDVAFRRGPLEVDFTARSVTLDGRAVHLTAKEYSILELLVSNPGRLYRREEIIDRVWDSNFSAETNIVDVYVRNLRRKVGDWAIETVRGLGYRFPADSGQ